MAVKEWFRRLQPVQLYLVLFFTTTFFIVEIIASHVTHSLTLLLNAYHMLCNIVALVGCIASVKYGNQDKCSGNGNCSSNAASSLDVRGEKGSLPSLPVNSKELCSDRRMKNTFGWARIDILTMLMCCVFLASFCFTLLVEALQTLIHIGHLDQMHLPMTVMGIGISGIILNVFCYIIIGGYTFNQSLFLHVTKDGNVVLQRNVTAVSLNAEQQLTPTRSSPIAMPKSQGLMEICRDVSGCIFVVVASILVHFTYEEIEPGTPSPNDISKFFDPVIAIISAICLFALSYPYLRESCMILLQTIPNHINIDSLKKELLAAFPGIVNVHDLHVWHLAGTKIISTVHIIFLDPMVYASITDQVTAFFMEMGITQVTIQPEFHRPNVDKTDCLIRCRGKRCIQSQCCNTDELLDEIITRKSGKELHTINKKFVKKEIIPAPSDVNLKKFVLNKSDSTKSVPGECTKKSDCNHSSSEECNCGESNVRAISVDVNCANSVSTDDEMVGDETPCSVMAF